MARAALIVEEVVRGGLEWAETVIGVDGLYFANTGVEFLLLRNSDASDRTVTIDIPYMVDSQAVADKTIVITVGERRIAGPWPTKYYSQSDQTVYVDASSAGVVYASALKLTTS